MLVYNVNYEVRFEGKDGWIALETSILHASDDGMQVISEVFQEIMDQKHADPRETPSVPRKVVGFRLRGLTTMAPVDMLSPTVLQKLGLQDDPQVPMDIRGNAPLT